MFYFSLVYPVFILTFSKCQCFNIDTKNPIIYLDQTKYLNVTRTNKSSYFGLSVILYSGDNLHSPWIQIGAPRSNSPNVEFKNPGIIFRCVVGGLCHYLEVDTEGEDTTTDDLVYRNKLDDAWIGAIMDINTKFDRSVVCAPRWVNNRNVGENNHNYWMLGVCYWFNLHDENSHKKIPLLKSDYNIYDDNSTGEERSLHHYGLGESGFAINMPETKNEVLLGAPGVFNWKGTNILFKDKAPYDVDDVNIADAITTTQINHNELSGYAVTSGCFYSKTPHCLYYVTGAPRSTKYFGKILIYKFQKSSEQALNVKESKQGTQFGEYFGASLASGDINNDGLDDLFVGAPYHKTTSFNEGRVYMFLGSEMGLLEPFAGKFIDGAQFGSHFGTTVTYLGKLNTDTYSSGPNYVAVSAPYEESTGVVYIFRGRDSGMHIVPVQKIVGSSFLPNLKGFGISISKPADIDGNGYDDIAIGAYESGHVVLLRSRPLVKLETYFQSTPKQILKEQDEFDITICHKYSSFKGNDSVKINRTILVDEVHKRAFLNAENEETKQLTLSLNKTNCEKMAISLDDVNNIYTPLVIKVTHTLIEEEKVSNKLLIGDKKEGTDEFCKGCGIYDDVRSSRIVSKEIPFVPDCGNDNICHSVLETESRFRGFGVENNTFLIGATNVIEIDVLVKNKGEKAYSLRVQMDLPRELRYKQIPTMCERQKLRIICPVADPLGTNKEKSISLGLDMNYINSRIEENSIFVNVTVLTSSNNSIEPFRSVELKLKAEADIFISGKSAEQSFYYGNGTTVEFQQIYQISKYGFSPVFLVQFEILIPYKLRTAAGNVSLISLHRPKGSFGGQFITFDSDIPYIDLGNKEAIVKIDQNTISEIRYRMLASNASEVISFTNSNIKQESMDSGLLGTEIYQINCTMEKVICAKVSGKIGSFEGEKKSAVVELGMIFDTKAIDGFQKSTVIRFTTYGIVKIEVPHHLVQSRKRPDMVSVSSFFMNDVDGKNIELWIIILSAILGFFLLLLITFGLNKAGFFKRSKKAVPDHSEDKYKVEEVDE